MPMMMRIERLGWIRLNMYLHGCEFKICIGQQDFFGME